MTCLFPVLLFFSTLLAAPAPLPSSTQIPRLESEKNVGLAALEEGNFPEAKKRFEAVRRLAPGEPLGWADGAIVELRGKELAQARSLLSQAVKLAPGDARVLALEGTLRELEGNFPGAVEAYEKAAAANPKDLISR